MALARAIVRSPQVFLMDEPLSNLDAALRVQTRADIVSLQDRLGTTTLYVTHDQVEAMTMGDRIAVLDGGVLQQVAPPQDLYASPANVFVAGFLGSPGMNLLPGVLTGDSSALRVAVSGGTFPVPTGVPVGAVAGTEIVFGVRPEAMKVEPEGPLGATVTIVELLGAEAHVLCRLADGTRFVIRQEASSVRPGIGEAIRVAVDPGAGYLFAADGRRLEPAR